MNKVDFGSPKELAKRHPADQSRWFAGGEEWEPREGWGEIGDAVEHPEYGRCISIFIGQGRDVLISEDGRYVGENEGGHPRVRNGAWISEHLYAEVSRRFDDEIRGASSS